MAALRTMPPIVLDKALLASWGQIWLGTVRSEPKPKSKTKNAAKAIATPGAVPQPASPKPANSFDRKQSMDFGLTFDSAFGAAVAAMLGNIPVVNVNSDDLIPPQADCVEVGKTRIVGGIRPQNYDAAYRPDGPRIVYDSKTLNERKSIGKNWQNMINDLATEASTVHTRFPMCIVGFIVAVPRPALDAAQERDLIRTLERLGSRNDELDQNHLAEAISLVVWNPEDGTIDANVPPITSNLRLERMHVRINEAYLDRYKNLPPHQEVEEEADEIDEDIPGVT